MDRTTTAVARQLRAMGCQEVEAGIRDSATGKMILKTWTVAELMRSIPWLKARNACGCDIYVRPNGPTALILLDDLSIGRARELAPADFAPCCTTQTSPGNYQAWVRLADQPIEPDLITAAARILASRFNGDPNSANKRHFGRLAGFTNQKPNRRNDQGRAPFVLLESATRESASAGAILLQEAERTLEASRTAFAPREPVTPAEGLPDPLVAFREGVERLRKAFGGTFDPSAADWEVASRMVAQGFTREQVEVALRNSPDLEQRKLGHVEAYVRLTLNKLWPEAGGF